MGSGPRTIETRTPESEGMKRFQLPLAGFFLVSALAFAYWYVSNSPWTHPGGNKAGHTNSRPQGPPGTGPTPEMMARWMKESAKSKNNSQNKKGDDTVTPKANNPAKPIKEVDD